MLFFVPALAVLLLSSVRVSAPLPPTQPQQVAAAAKAVDAAYHKVEAKQAKLPPPRNDHEKLLRLQVQDQAGREVLANIDLSRLSADDRSLPLATMNKQIARHDLVDQADLKALTPKSGWFPISVYGRDGALAAWLIVQHATNDPELMHKTVEALDRLRRTGEAQSTAYAIMYDRVALMFDHKPQRYGTQLECRLGRSRPQHVEDPAHLDSRRLAIGFKQTEALYIKEMDDGYCRRMGK